MPSLRAGQWRLAALFAVLVSAATYGLVKPVPARSVDAQLVIAVIGDYGCAAGSSCGNATTAQGTAVASMVHAWGPNAIFTVGDNSYEYGCGPQNPADSRCPAGSNDIQPDQQPYLNDITNGIFYEVVGNHDAYHIQNATTGGSGPNCLTTANCGYLYNRPSHYVAHLGSGLLDLFATDMNSADPDGDSSTSVQAQRYLSDVNASTAIWKITAGHQAFYSSGPQHGTQNYTHWAILPQIDLFLSGHDHDMEHLTYQGQHFVVAGVGGKSLYGFGKNPLCPFARVSGVSDCPATTVWRDDVAPYHYGAVRLTVTPTSLLVEFVGISTSTAAGTLLNSFTLTKAAATGSISGQVIDGSTGAAIGGARVSYGPGSATADATGHYVLSGVPAGAYSLTASAAGYVSQTQPVTVKAGTDTGQNFSLTPNPGSITGQVVDGSLNYPLAGATVSYSGGSATTDATGHYTLASVKEGTYTVSANAPNYSSQSATVAVGPGATVTQNFSLIPNPGSITGQVVDGSSTLPLAGAIVSYSGGSATTDANGHYTLASVKEGTYTVGASALNYGSQSVPVPVGPGATITQNFSLTPSPGSITGQVVDASTTAAVAGAVVSYSGGSAATDASGHYMLANVTPGTYTVTAAAGGYTSQSATVLVGRGATATQNFSLTPNPGTITGQVVDASTGKALAGAAVSYSGGSATTDATGHYTLASVKEGTYTVSASVLNYTGQSATVPVGPGATVTQNFSLTPNPGTVTGQVVDASTNAAVAGAIVSYSGGSATTDASGHFTLANVTPGTYAVTAAAGGYTSQSATVPVGPGATATQNFRLTPSPASITGQVLDASTNAVVAGAIVSYSGGSATADATGHYTLANVTPGTYTVMAAAGGYTSQSAAVLVGRGATVTQNFNLTPNPGSITGQVIDASTGKALAGATVSYSGANVSTDATGHYTLASVKEGTYAVTANVLNYSSQSATVPVGPGTTVTQNFSLIPNPGNITGLVVDASTGKALAGATVSYSGGGVSTDATGHYTLASVKEGTFAVTASVLNYGSQSATVVVGPGATVTQNFNLTPNPGSITGQVVDASTGKALAGATVSYSGASVSSDATGHYTLASVKEGTYAVTASVLNYTGQSATVPVGPGATVTQNFSLIPNPGNITGQVVDANSGKALAGATVSCSGGGVSTDATGHYTLASVKEGTYVVTASVLNYSSQSATVVVGPGATVTQNFSLIPNPGSITGQVVDASTGTALAGATVSYTGGSTTSDASGHYTLASVKEGTYAVTASVLNYSSQSATVVLGPGATVTQNFSVIPSPGSITGQVIDAGTGRALAGATVSYSGGSASTDGTGHYTLASVKEGTYLVTASVLNYGGQSATVPVGPGAAVTQNFSLIPNPGTITGQVVDAGTATALAGATVSYSGGSATTDASGHYTLATVTPGSYTVTGAASGYTSQSTSVSVSAGTTTTQNFSLSLIAIFSDGFESGSLSAWTTNSGLAVETTTVHTGSYAAQASTSSNAVYARKLLSSTYVDLYYRAYVYIKSQGGTGVNLMYFRTASGFALLHLSISSTGRLGIRNDVAGISTVSSILPSLNAWHALEMHATINGTSSTIEVWLDDTHVTALEGPSDLGTTPIGMIQVGDNLSGKPYDFLVDDVVVQNSHVGLATRRLAGRWTR